MTSGGCASLFCEPPALPFVKMGGQTDLGLLIAFKNLGFALTLIFPYNPLPLIF